MKKLFLLTLTSCGFITTQVSCSKASEPSEDKSLSGTTWVSSGRARSTFKFEGTRFLYDYVYDGDYGKREEHGSGSYIYVPPIIRLTFLNPRTGGHDIKTVRVEGNTLYFEERNYDKR